MPILQDILYKVSLRSVQGSTAVDVDSLHIDSREVKPGGCFIAVRGVSSDGHMHIPAALDKGARVIVCEDLPEERREGVTYVQVANSAEATGYMAHEFYGRPSGQLKLVGVTGTNGKTTIATLLFKLLTELDHICGLVSTVQNQIGNAIIPATHTTPDAIQLNALLRRMADAGCSHVFMECSSHAIHQHRITGLQFTGAIFSNITHDHLDYHKTFNEYIRVKKSFFDNLGTVMLQNTPADKFYYSLRSIADFKGRILDNSLAGLQMLVNEQEVQFRLIGEFNAYNLLAVYATAICLGEDRQEVLRVLSNLTGAEGRFDYTVSANERIIAIVDYAHTPDALLNVLTTLRNLSKGGEKIITVVGCGGNRDRTKRPVMAEVACEHSDRAIFTSDNPRDEEPEAIIREMEEGIPVKDKRKVISITDRREAIKTAISLAGRDDIVLVAGKGHEKYQEVAGVKHPFDDKEVVREVFEMLGK